MRLSAEGLAKLMAEATLMAVLEAALYGGPQETEPFT
jgi:hypothetical protein